MARIMLPLAIVGSVLGQLPTADWKEITALGILGVVLIWIVTKTQPAMLRQVTQLTETFAKTVEEVQTKHAAIAENFARLTADAVATANAQHDRQIEVGVQLAKAIGETGQVLAGLQAHCAKQAETKT